MGAVQAMVETAIATFGRLDLAFNNAGISGGARPDEFWDSAIFNDTFAILKNAKNPVLVHPERDPMVFWHEQSKRWIMVLYGTGSGVARDEVQARKLFERAAEAGNPRGVTNLAALSGGGGAPADPARARQLLAKAAETNAEAQYQLGLMMADGTGGPADDAAARALFEKAAGQNHPGALERMGAFAQSGRGGPKDSDAAKAYYEKSAALGNQDAKKALERARCPYVIKDKRGNTVTNLCF